jgi:5-methylcytosine-specific restriction endonuclease McrA
MSLSKLRSKKRRGVTNEQAVFKQMRTRAWHKQQGRCFFCEEEIPLELITGDHFVPRYAGGQTLPGNIVAACAKCNNERCSEETNQRGNGFSCVVGDDTPRSPFEILKDKL